MSVTSKKISGISNFAWHNAPKSVNPGLILLQRNSVTYMIELTDRLSTELQKKDLSAGAGREIVVFSIKQLEHYRIDEKFTEVWKSASYKALELYAEGPNMPRQRRLPAKLLHKCTESATQLQ